jgi:lipopolysaccharide transport system permease protein
LGTPSKPAKENPLPEVVYLPKPQLREPLALLRGLARDFVGSRHLAFRLLLRTLRSQYRQSWLGYFWIAIAPIAATGVLLFLNRQNIFQTVETTIPYGLYVFAGFLFWQIFTDSYQRPIQWLSTYRFVMGRVNFPREALILGALCEVLIQAGIRISMLVFVLLWFGREIGVTFLFAPLAVFVLIGFGLVVGLILAPIGLLYGDVERGMNLVMVFWFTMTPVVYSPPASWPASLLNQVNPVTPLIVTARELVFGTGLTQWNLFLVVSALVIATLFVGSLFLRLALPHLVERVSV